MSVLVDSSVWIDYFGGTGEELDYLIGEALVATNELILAELVPALHMRRQRQLISLLREIPRHPLHIDWESIVEMQIICLRNGLNRVGIPALTMAQHAMQHGLELLSRDTHFAQLSQHVPLVLY